MALTMDLRSRPATNRAVFRSKPTRSFSADLATCNFEVAWESPWQRIRNECGRFFQRAAPGKGFRAAGGPGFSCGLGARALARARFHGFLALARCGRVILILPIWGFLPQPEHTLPPVQIEVTYVPAQDLPHISLARAASRRPRPQRKRLTQRASRRRTRRGRLSSPADDSFGSGASNAPASNSDPAGCAEDGSRKSTRSFRTWCSGTRPRCRKPQLQLSPTAAAPAHSAARGARRGHAGSSQYREKSRPI